MAPLLTPRRILAARVVAVAVDLAQYALLPAELTPLNNFVDVATAITLVGLVGWNWAFLPTFLAELVPFVDLVPTWTLAVLFATRGQKLPTVPPAGPPTGPGAPPPPPPLPPPGQARDASGS
jgi:hypothetical protein